VSVGCRWLQSDKLESGLDGGACSPVPAVCSPHVPSITRALPAAQRAPTSPAGPGRRPPPPSVKRQTTPTSLALPRAEGSRERICERHAPCSEEMPTRTVQLSGLRSAPHCLRCIRLQRLRVTVPTRSSCAQALVHPAMLRRRLHFRSSRHERPMRAERCAGLSVAFERTRQGHSRARRQSRANLTRARRGRPSNLLRTTSSHTLLHPRRP
jgi:hypothetical protein